MDDKIRELLERSAHNRRQLIKVSLQSCATALEIADFQLSVGNAREARKEVAFVEKGVRTIQHFLAGATPAQRTEVEASLAELAKALEQLKARLGD
jgi:hypothetical protein